MCSKSDLLRAIELISSCSTNQYKCGKRASQTDPRENLLALELVQLRRRLLKVKPGFIARTGHDGGVFAGREALSKKIATSRKMFLKSWRTDPAPRLVPVPWRVWVNTRQETLRVLLSTPRFSTLFRSLYFSLCGRAYATSSRRLPIMAPKFRDGDVVATVMAPQPPPAQGAHHICSSTGNWSHICTP